MSEGNNLVKTSKYNVFFEDGDKIVSINFLSKAIARVDKVKFKKIKEILQAPNEERSGEYKKLKKDLLFGGYLVNERFDEIQHLKMLNLMERFNASSMTFTIMPTMECNFDCVYCYESKTGPSMDETTAKSVAESISRMASQKKSIHVSWFGGEPLLKFDTIKFVNECVNDACERNKTNFSSSMSTNGYLLDDEKAKQFDDLKIMSVQITLDGLPDYHNKYRYLKGGGPTFEKIYANMKHLLEVTKNVSVNLRVNVGPDNYESISSLMDMFDDFPKERILIYFRWIFGSNKATDFYEKVREFQGNQPYKKLSTLYLKALNKNFSVLLPLLGNANVYCEYDKISSVLIGPKGELHRCTVLNNDPIGKLTADGPKYDSIEYEKWHKPSAFEDEDCLKCKLLPLCGGGCRLSRMNGYKGCPEEITDVEGFARLWYVVKEKEREKTNALKLDKTTIGSEKK